MARILIADDEPVMHLLISSILQNTGLGPAHELLTAENGRVAIELLAKERVDLIITDLVMPERTGIDLIMEIRQIRPNVKILAMSGGGGINGRFDYLPIAKLVGADIILRKPFKRTELCAAVTELLG